MKKLSKKNHGKMAHKTAFTLIEMSIVILVASILITGLLSASVSSISNSNVKVTNDRMKEIYKALGNFVAANGRLPCPASLRMAKTTNAATYGSEPTRGTGTDVCVAASDVGVYESTATNMGRLVYGAVPVRALGLPSDMAEDGFGSKIVYIMNQDFADVRPVAASLSFTGGSFPGGAAYALSQEAAVTSPSLQLLTIQERYGAATSNPTLYGVVALISYGPNKLGAFNANSTVQNAAPTDADEISNSISSIGTTTASFDGTLVSVSSSSDTFDDIVVFKTIRDFVGDFNLMSLIPCQAPVDNTGYTSNNVNAYYGQVVYGNTCTVPSGSTNSKKCDVYGTWITLATCVS